MEDHPGTAFLAVPLVGHTHDLHVPHLGIGQIEFLDLTGIQILTAADDHILQSAGDLVVSVGCAAADVAGMEPAVGVDGLGGGLGHLVIALHNVEAPGHEFTAFPVGEFFARFGIDDLTLHPGEGAAHRFHTVVDILVHLTHGASGGGLGLTVDGDDFLHIHLLGGTAHQIGGAVGTRHNAGTHIGEIRLGKIRMVEHGDEHGGHAVEAGDVLIVHAGQGGFGGEIGDGAQSAAVGHHGRHGKHHAEAVEHGHLDHHTVRRGQIHTVADGLAVVHDVPMGQHNALGESGSTGGVLHIAYVVRLHQRSTAAYLLAGNHGGAGEHLLPRQTAGHGEAHGDHVAQKGQILRIQRLAGGQGGELRAELLYDFFIIDVLAVLDHHQSVGVGLTEQVFDLVDLVGGVHRHQYGADLGGSPEGDEPGGHVGGPNGHVIAGLHAQRDQGGGALVHIPTELGVGAGVIQGGVFERVLIGVFFRHGVQNRGEGGIDHVVLFPDKRAGLCPIVVGVLIALLFPAEGGEIIDKMGQHDVRIVDLLVPRGADVAVVIQGGEGTHQLLHGQIPLADEDGAAVFHIAQAHVLDVRAQGLNGRFRAFARTEIGAPHVPGRADGGGGEVIDDLDDILRARQMSHRLKEDLHAGLFRTADGLVQFRLQNIKGNGSFRPHDYVFHPGGRRHIYVLAQGVGIGLRGFQRMGIPQSGQAEAPIEQFPSRIGGTVPTEDTVGVLGALLQSVVDFKSRKTVLVGKAAQIEKGGAGHILCGKNELHITPPRRRSYSRR